MRLAGTLCERTPHIVSAALDPTPPPTLSANQSAVAARHSLPRTVLGHPTVLIHELSHTFHHAMGWNASPLLARTFARAKACKADIERRFTITNPSQFESTFINKEEFVAYCMEAYHSRPPDFSACGIRCVAVPTVPAQWPPGEPPSRRGAAGGPLLSQ